MIGIPSTFAYELRLGVTGHRTISDPVSVREGVNALLALIKKTLNGGDSPQLAWTIVCPLARGSDRLVAEAVLEMPGSRLEVVTPFPLAEYRKDFDSKDDLSHFNCLINHAAQVHELGGPTHEREIAYLRVGEQVVDACEIIIAIWNGRRAAGIGGTAEIVEYALQRERVVLWINPEKPEDPPRVIRSVTYSGQPGVDAASVSTEEMPKAARQLSLGFHQQAAYCADPHLDRAGYAGAVNAARQDLTSAAAKTGLPMESLEPVLAKIMPEFVRADQLALFYQRKHIRTITGVLYVAAFAVTVAVAQVLFFPDLLWIILFEVAAMVGVFGLWRRGRRGAWHEKWLHDRYLAERLRTAMFTTLAGAAPSSKEPDDPLPFYRGPQQWLALGVDRLSLSARGAGSPPFQPLQRFLALAWLDHQRRFHEQNEVNKSRSARRRYRLGLALFGTTLVMALMHLGGVGHTSESGTMRILRLDLWITFLAILLPVWAGSIHAVTSQLEFERIAERSSRMKRVLTAIAHRSAQARTPGELQQVVREAAELMKVENHEWWVLLSFQEVRLHV